MSVLWLLACLGAGTLAHAQDTAFIFNSDAGDYVGKGKQGTLAPPGARLTASFTRAGGTVMNVYDQGWLTWSLRFTMPLGAVPSAGVYPLKGWVQDGSLGRLIINTQGQSSGGWYDNFAGTVEIKKAIFDAQGLAALWLTVDVRYFGTPNFHGEFRWNSDSQAASVNQAPQAAFTLPESVDAGTPLSLQPAITDDGLPAGSPVQAHWEILGAGAAYGTFADADAAATTVTFREPGNYTLRLRVSDGEKEDVVERAIRVDSPLGRNLLHVINAPAVLRAGAEVVQTYRWLFSNHLDSTGYTDFQKLNDYWAVGTSSGTSALVTPGAYDSTSASSAVPRLRLGNVYTLGQPLVTTKFEVRQGTRILDGDRYGAFWATFPIYGLEDDPVALGEFRYNIPAETVAGAAPVVDAGQDRVFTRLSERRLHGAALAITGASDAPLQTQWQLVSGPGEVAFTDATAPETDVALTALGTYVFRLTATQGAVSAADEVTVEVTDRETSLVMRDYRLPPAEAAQYLTLQDWAFHVQSFTPDTVVIAVDRRHPGANPSPQDHLWLTFSTGTAEPLSAKAWFDTVSPAETGVRLSVCPPDYANVFVGQFAIKDLQVDAAGNLQVFRVSFTQFETDLSSRREELPLEGELRWRADVSHDGPNLPPRVSAGPPQYVVSGSTAKMAASVQDDLLPVGRSLDLRWETVSGPGTATADGPNPQSIVTFPKPGIYVLRYTASDGEYTSSDEVTIVVGSATQTYRGFLTKGNVILGSFQAVVTATGHFTALLNVNGAKLPLAGTFAGGEWYTVRYDTTIHLYRPADNGPITGDLDSLDDHYHMVSAPTSETYLRATQQTSPYTGAYTWLTDVPTAGAGPLGFNYGTARVNANGSCAMVGHLSDGKTLSYGGWVDLAGMVPLVWTIPHVELMAGTVQFARRPLNGISMAGSLPWSRAPQPRDPRFGLGFGYVTRLLGARYVAPAAGLNAATLQKGAIGLSINSWADAWGPRHDDRTLQASGAVSIGKGLQMSVDRRNGLFSGVLLDPKGKVRHFGGALLQGLNAGGGNFLTDSGGGVVQVTTPVP
ncbi:MAG TPA: hypothetical protein VGO11_09545 [Chthoniobacteraceae bacterium]|nr:hypothetical protein [Chthoniobacteraceae bacterium]